MKKLSTLIFFLLTITLSFSQSAKDFYKDGKKNVKAEDYENAIGNLTKAIALDKEFADAYLLRGEAYVNIKRNDLAIEDYKVAAKHFDKRKSVQYETAKVLFEEKQYEASIPYTLKALDIESSYVPAMALNYKALFHSEKYAEAEKMNVKAIEADDEQAEAYFYQGMIAFKQGKMPEAEAGLVECAKRNGEYKGVYTALAEVRFDRKVYDKVVPTCNLAIKKDPKDEKAFLIKGEALLKLNKMEEAITCMTEMAAATNDAPIAFRMRGVYNLAKGDVFNAKKDFTHAIELNPNYIAALNDRAHLYEKENNNKLASNDYQTLIKITPEKEGDQKIISDAERRIYELNKESEQPKIQLVSHEVDDKNTISVLSNIGVQPLKIQVNDESDIKRVTIDGNDVAIQGTKRNPFIAYEMDLSKLTHFRVEVEDIYLNKNSQTYNVRVKKLTPPEVKLLEPYASSNGETYVDRDLQDLFVEGKITHSEKIKSIKVNGINASFLPEKLNPSFSAKIDITNLTKFTVEVEGEYGTSAQKEFNLIRTEVSADNPMGKTWVIFIENSNYENFSSLEGPTKDINLIKSALAPYSISKVIHKRNMGKEDLSRFFAIELRDLISKNRVNSLMVWYAGHGKFVNETGYWIPVDAKRDEEYSYYNINTLRASMQSYDKVLVHNLVITDACESGPSFYLAMRDTPKERVCGDWEATKFRSAQVLSSAGYELAVDNSQFTKTFAAMLQHNPDNCIPIEKISHKVVEAVAQNGSQKPSLGKIKGLEDQNGTFFFIKRE